MRANARYAFLSVSLLIVLGFLSVISVNAWEYPNNYNPEYWNEDFSVMKIFEQNYVYHQNWTLLLEEKINSNFTWGVNDGILWVKYNATGPRGSHERIMFVRGANCSGDFKLSTKFMKPSNSTYTSTWVLKDKNQRNLAEIELSYTHFVAIVYNSTGSYVTYEIAAYDPDEWFFLDIIWKTPNELILTYWDSANKTRRTWSTTNLRDTANEVDSILFVMYTYGGDNSATWYSFVDYVNYAPYTTTSNEWPILEIALLVIAVTSIPLIASQKRLKNHK